MTHALENCTEILSKEQPFIEAEITKRTSKNAFCIRPHKGVRLTNTIKKEIKDIGCRYDNLHKAYICPIEYKEKIDSLFKLHNLNISIVEIFDFSQKKSKKINNIENSLEYLLEKAQKDYMQLLGEVEKYDPSRHISDFAEPSIKENFKEDESEERKASRFSIEMDFHKRYLQIKEDEKEIENLTNSKKFHEKEECIATGILDNLQKNEIGDAELFVEKYKDKYVFDPTEGKSGSFYLWNGRNWELDLHKARYKDFDAISNDYSNASKNEKLDEKTKSALSLRAHQLRTDRRRRSVLETVSAHLSFKKSWDCIPKLLPCENGVFDLNTGIFSAADSSQYIRKVCPVKYNPKAQSPLFNQFLDDITLNDSKLKSFLGRVLGSALLGTSKEEKVFIFYGKDGRNGKGTLMQTLEKVLGPIAKTFPSEMLLLQRNPPSSSTPRPEKANLQGVRFAIFSEIDEKRQIDASEVKNLSGGDTITCRRLFSNHDIQIRPTHTMFIQTNFKPKASAKDGALWKRNVLVPFNAEFVNEPKEPHQRKIDEGFKEKLLSESEGILNWLIQGCFEYQKIGLSIPQIVTDETENYRKENDGIQLFLEEMCIQDPAFSTLKSKMTLSIQKYCKENNYETPSRNEISGILKQKFNEGHNRTGDFWRGVKIYAQED